MQLLSQINYVTSTLTDTLSIAEAFQLALRYRLMSSSPQCECSQPWMPDQQAAYHSATITAQLSRPYTLSIAIP